MTSVLDCRQVASDAGLDAASQQQLAEIARRAANLGAAVLMQHYGRLSSIKSKGRVGDLVTNADLAAEQVVLDYLRTHTPSIAILAEESGPSGPPGSLCWCIDPLDGTTNFAHGYPFFCYLGGLDLEGKTTIGLSGRPVPERDLLVFPPPVKLCEPRPHSGE